MHTRFWFALIVSLLLLAVPPESALAQSSDAQSAASQTTSAETARGYVYHDRNGNEEMDPGETGLSGVAVSNGVQVTLTSEDGSWELPARDEAVFFVVKPEEWMTPVGQLNLPRFSYVHRPEGSPRDLEYEGVEPTGPLPEEINFPLYPQKSGDRFTAVLFGDTQPYSRQEVDYVAQDIVHELIGAEGLEFGMTLGDIVGDDLELFQLVNEAVAHVGIPWYNVAGNHDVNYDVPRDRLSTETFTRVYGPPTYAFEYGDAHFIVVDDVIYPEETGGDSYVGGLRTDQLRFVENYLEHVPEDALVVLAMHIPLAQHGDSFRQSDQARLFELLKDHPHTLSLSAHTHRQEHTFFEEDDSNWRRPEPHHHFNVGTTSGSWWRGMKGETGVPHTMMRDGTPNGYSFIRVDGNQYELDWKVAGGAEDYRMNIHTPDVITAGSKEAPKLTVNVFSGSERANVEYRLRKESSWTSMEQVDKADPYYTALFERQQKLEKVGLPKQWNSHPETEGTEVPGTDLPSPDSSSTLWEAPLGTDWAPGRHRVEVQVTDMFDRTYSAFHTFRVVEKGTKQTSAEE